MKQPNPIEDKLLEEWNWNRNTIRPEKISRGSGLLVWWLCKNGHEWQAKVYSKSHGRKCPYCSGRKVNESNCLATVSPSIAKEWDYDKNHPLTPQEVTSGSKKNIWWKCSNNHSWRCVVYDRKKGGCPYCSGKRASVERNFGICFPDLVKEWDSEKNGIHQPYDFSPSSNKKVWWKCKKNHTWESTLADRSKGRGCPRCYSQSSNIEFRILSELKYIFPHATHRKKLDGIEIDVFIPKENIGIEIDGFPWHKGKTEKDIIKAKRLRKKGIFLIKIRDERLKIISGEDIIYSESRIDINLVKSVLSLMKGSDRFNEQQVKLYADYLKQTNFVNEDLYNNYISQKIYSTPELSLKFVFPDKAVLWDQVKNGDLYPEDVGAYAHLQVWWKCKEGHQWNEWVYKVSGLSISCPTCREQSFVSEKSLKVNAPELVKEWDYDKNLSILPENVSTFSGIKVWWKCDLGHSWEAQISNRSRGAGCPYCNSKMCSEDKSLYSLRSDLMREWDYKKNKNIDPKKITINSHKKVWWSCLQGHSWVAEIANRNNGTGCPECWKIRRGSVKKT